MVWCKIFFKKIFNRYSKSMSYGFKLAQTYFPDSGTAGTCNCLTGKPRQSLQLDICNRAGFHNIFDIAWIIWGFLFIFNIQTYTKFYGEISMHSAITNFISSLIREAG